MSQQLVARNRLVDWQVAPAEYEIANYDWPMIEYRKSVERLIAALPRRTLKKKTFITICTNVLCAEIESSKDAIDPIDRDIYLPLEIALTKWSVSDAGRPVDECKTYHWLLNPGNPPRGCVNYAMDHKKKHKIEFAKLDTEQDTFIDTDNQKIIKEINSILTPERTLFSLNLKHCRQDLGCLKWLNRETGYKTKPIQVYSLEDLYVVLLRNLADDEQLKLSICQGLARHRMEYTSNPYEPSIQCRYHKERAIEDEEQVCVCCARALSASYTAVLLTDIKLYTEIFDSSPSTAAQGSGRVAEGH